MATSRPFFTDQVSTALFPAATIGGSTVNRSITGAASCTGVGVGPGPGGGVTIGALADTVTTTLAGLADALAVMACRVYLVVVFGVTTRKPAVSTTPISGSIRTSVAFLTDHARVALRPACTAIGSAVKRSITGTAPAGAGLSPPPLVDRLCHTK